MFTPNDFVLMQNDETGEITLCVPTPMGVQPMLSWTSVDTLKDGIKRAKKDIRQSLDFWDSVERYAERDFREPLSKEEKNTAERFLKEALGDDNGQIEGTSG